MSRCRSCNAEIIWAETTSGKRMPLDAQPTGKVIVLGRGDSEPLALVQDGYRSHFESCPNAAQHRRPR